MRGGRFDGGPSADQHRSRGRRRGAPARRSRAGCRLSIRSRMNPGACAGSSCPIPNGTLINVLSHKAPRCLIWLRQRDGCEILFGASQSGRRPRRGLVDGSHSARRAGPRGVRDRHGRLSPAPSSRRPVFADSACRRWSRLRAPPGARADPHRGRRQSWRQDRRVALRPADGGCACLPPGMGHLEGSEADGRSHGLRVTSISAMTGYRHWPTRFDFIAGGLVETVGGIASTLILFRFSWWAPLAPGRRVDGDALSAARKRRLVLIATPMKFAARSATPTTRTHSPSIPPASKEAAAVRSGGDGSSRRFVSRRTKLHDLQHHATPPS